MIAREDSQTARIKRQRIVQAELCTEISDGVLLADMCRQRQLGPGLCVAHVIRESPVQTLNTIRERGISRHLCEPQIRNLAQQQTRILFTLRPQVWIEIAEDFRAIGRPTPPIAPRQISQRCERGRKFTASHARAGSGVGFSIRSHLIINEMIWNRNKSKAAAAAKKNL